MKLTRSVIIIVGLLVAVCSGLPAGRTNDEVESVMPVNAYGDQPIVDTGYFGGFDNPFPSNPFGGLFDSLEGIMDRMRQQIESLINRHPIPKGTNSSDSGESPSFPSFINGVDLPAFPSVGDIDLSKGNTTSITKVIDGRTVVINETEYKNEDDFGGTFFKVRIIDVKPDSSELTTEREAESVPDTQPQENKDREEIGNSSENEIPNETEKSSNTSENHDNINLYDNIQKIDDEFENIETFEEVDSMPTIVHNQGNTPIDSTEARVSTNKNSEWFEEESSKAGDPEWGNIKTIVPIASNAIEFEENVKEPAEHQPLDLSRDTYVNEILARNGAPVNPDAEVFFIGQDPEKISQLEHLIDPR